jgi:hypothetical protein
MLIWTIEIVGINISNRLNPQCRLIVKSARHTFVCQVAGINSAAAPAVGTAAEALTDCFGPWAVNDARSFCPASEIDADQPNALCARIWLICAPLVGCSLTGSRAYTLRYKDANCYNALGLVYVTRATRQNFSLAQHSHKMLLF